MMSFILKDTFIAVITFNFCLWQVLRNFWDNLMAKRYYKQKFNTIIKSMKVTFNYTVYTFYKNKKQFSMLLFVKSVRQIKINETHLNSSDGFISFRKQNKSKTLTLNGALVCHNTTLNDQSCIEI